MQSNPTPQLHHRPDLEKKEFKRPSAELGAGEVAEAMDENPTQFLLTDGLPAWIGGSAAMAVVGAPLVPALAVGLVSGLAVTILRTRGGSH
jgi:hypothetical protein